MITAFLIGALLFLAAFATGVEKVILGRAGTVLLYV